MKIYIAATAAFLLSSEAQGAGFLPTNPTVQQTRVAPLNMAMMGNDLASSMAGAFNQLNDNMNAGDDAALRELAEISANFKKLANVGIGHIMKRSHDLPTTSISTQDEEVAPWNKISRAAGSSAVFPRTRGNLMGGPTSTALSAHGNNNNNNNGGGGGGDMNRGGPPPGYNGQSNNNGGPPPFGSPMSNGMGNPGPMNGSMMPPPQQGQGMGPPPPQGSNTDSRSSWQSINRETKGPPPNSPMQGPPRTTDSGSGYQGVSRETGGPPPNSPLQGPPRTTDAGSGWRGVSRETGGPPPNSPMQGLPRTTDSGSGWQGVSREMGSPQDPVRGPPPSTDSGSSFKMVNREGPGPPPGSPQEPVRGPARITDSGSSWTTVSRDGRPLSTRKAVSDTGASWDRVSIDTVSLDGGARRPHNSRAPIGHQPRIQQQRQYEQPRHQQRVTDSGSGYRTVHRDQYQNVNRAKPVSDTGASWQKVNIDTASHGLRHQQAVDTRRRVSDTGASWGRVDRETASSPRVKPVGDVGASWDKVSIDTKNSVNARYSQQRRITDSGSSWKQVNRDGPVNPRVKPISDVGASYTTVDIDTGSPGTARRPTNSRARITDSGSSWNSVSRETQSAPPQSTPRYYQDGPQGGQDRW